MRFAVARSALAGCALAGWLAACSLVPESGCDLVVATNPRGVVFSPGQALAKPDKVLASRQDIDFAGSSLGTEGSAGQRIDVITLKLDPEAAGQFDAFAGDVDGGNLVIAVDGIVVFSALPGHDTSEDGVMTTHSPPSDAVDLPAVMTRCGIPVADTGTG